MVSSIPPVAYLRSRSSATSDSTCESETFIFYLRLQHHQVVKLLDFKVPQLIEFDDLLQVVEMTIVSPPFVLDFAGAYLDRRPPFDDEIMAEWQAEKAEQFGDRWPTVRLLMSSFVPMEIYLADVKPGNIEFAPSASPSSD